MKADNCIALLQQMVAIPSESQNEQAFAEFLANYLREELSMETQLQHVDGKATMSSAVGIVVRTEKADSRRTHRHSVAHPPLGDRSLSTLHTRR